MPPIECECSVENKTSTVLVNKAVCKLMLEQQKLGKESGVVAEVPSKLADGKEGAVLVGIRPKNLGKEVNGFVVGAKTEFYLVIPGEKEPLKLKSEFNSSSRSGLGYSVKLETKDESDNRFTNSTLNVQHAVEASGYPAEVVFYPAGSRRPFISPEFKMRHPKEKEPCQTNP